MIAFRQGVSQKAACGAGFADGDSFNVNSSSLCRASGTMCITVHMPYAGTQEALLDDGKSVIHSNPLERLLAKMKVCHVQSR